MIEAWRRGLYVKSSPIHGLGLFARRTFATADLILVRSERPVSAESPLDESKGEYEYHCDWLESGRQVHLGFPERHVNHACDANSFLRTVGYERHLVALRPIHPGDEITNNYSVDLAGGTAWDCSCCSPRCLGTVPGNFFELPLDRQARTRATALFLVHRRAPRRIREPTTRDGPGSGVRLAPAPKDTYAGCGPRDDTAAD